MQIIEIFKTGVSRQNCRNYSMMAATGMLYFLRYMHSSNIVSYSCAYVCFIYFSVVHSLYRDLNNRE